VSLYLVQGGWGSGLVAQALATHRAKAFLISKVVAGAGFKTYLTAPIRRVTQGAEVWGVQFYQRISWRTFHDSIGFNHHATHLSRIGVLP
jgi:hypothetical protein